jgi:hypothetical protein
MPSMLTQGDANLITNFIIEKDTTNPTIARDPFRYIGVHAALKRTFALRDDPLPRIDCSIPNKLCIRGNSKFHYVTLTYVQASVSD